MDATTAALQAMTDTDRTIAAAFRRERTRLAGFIRRRVPDAADAEDILQEVFGDLVEAARLPEPIEQVGAWLYRVARNRIADLFRRQTVRSAVHADAPAFGIDDASDEPVLGEWLPADDGGPEAAYLRAAMLEALEAALAELPAAQRDVFVAHEIEGRSFKALAEDSGVALNTLLARKRYAVLHLRERLQAFHDDLLNP
jgi:RNA polymerase sigma factor (sigma-70 family)